MSILFLMVVILCSNHRHKKWKDCLEGSLDRVLFVAELEFPQIYTSTQVLPQQTSNVNIECAGKSEWSKQLYFLYLTSFLLVALIHLDFIILILICF